MTTQTLSADAVSDWKDDKKLLWLLSPGVPLLALVGLGIARSIGWGLFYWGGPLLIYGVIPLLDGLIGTDAANPPESAVAALENDRFYRAIVFAYIPLQFAVTVWGAWLAAHGDLTAWEWMGLVFTTGAINGIGINTAHELGHKKAAIERWMAKVTLAPVAYGHFYVEHTRGHHKNVATPFDPASSKMGETFWAFLPRTMIGSLKSAWRIEQERLARNGKGPWTVDNDNLQAWAMTLALFGVLTLWLGSGTLGFLLLQAFYGASLLEVVNYIEHYGLLRQREASGRYARPTPSHSWNSNNVVTNVFLYQLQRHSDHHANPTRRFQTLRHFDDSPQLPSGYASMLIPAYIPWLWFRQMDPLVVKRHDGDLTCANLYPPKREQLLRRWMGARLDDGKPELFPGSHELAGAGAQPQATRYQCADCGYVYDEALGCRREGFPAGTPWSAIPDNWTCPDCAVRDKTEFRRLNSGTLYA
jgi:alkane 1-monooxygenase